MACNQCVHGDFIDRLPSGDRKTSNTARTSVSSIVPYVPKADYLV